MQPIVVMEGIRKYYRMGEVTIQAVDGIDLTIEKGEFTVIVGPSGAGKNNSAEYPGRHGYCR